MCQKRMKSVLTPVMNVNFTFDNSFDETRHVARIRYQHVDPPTVMKTSRFVVSAKM